VNLVTPALFKAYPDAKALANATVEDLEPVIHSTGFFRQKGKALVGMAQMLVAEHKGKVPADMELLTQLPGVDEKDDIASRSFIAVENTAGNEIRGVGFLDGTRGIVVLLTCGASQCTTIEDAQALAQTIYGKLKQVLRDTNGGGK
jgi:endonuclease-3